MNQTTIPPSCKNWPLKKIALKYKCSVATACKLRRRLGNRRRDIDWSSVDWARTSSTEVSKRLGVSLSAASRKRAEVAPETLKQARG